MENPCERMKVKGLSQIDESILLSETRQLQSNSSAGSADNGEHSGEARDNIIIMLMNSNATKVFSSIDILIKVVNFFPLSFTTGCCH